MIYFIFFIIKVNKFYQLLQSGPIFYTRNRVTLTLLAKFKSAMSWCDFWWKPYFRTLYCPFKDKEKYLKKLKLTKNVTLSRMVRNAIQTSSHNPTWLFCNKNGHQCFDQVLPPTPTHRCPACGNIVLIHSHMA